MPGVVDQGPDSPVELGVKFYSEVGGAIKGIRFYKSSANTGTHVGNLWSSDGHVNGVSDLYERDGFRMATGKLCDAGADQFVHDLRGLLPLQLRPLQRRRKLLLVYRQWTIRHCTRLSVTKRIWGVNGVYAYGANSTFPNQTFNATNYWVDVVLQAGPAPTLSSIAVTPGNPTISTGATQQFTAMGTYSDGSTQNITSQVAWSSSNTSWPRSARAGWPRRLAPGNTTISATRPA